MPALAVIGAGRLGRSLAVRAAGAGYPTILEDVLPSRLRAAGELALEARLGPGAVRFAATVEEAVREADLVIDCVPDELESKLEIFSLIDRMAPPRSVIATPSRELGIADLAACTYRSRQCLALRLDAAVFEALGPGDEVEIVRTRETDAAALALVTDFVAALGLRAAVSPDAAALGRPERPPAG
jgi:3-hydroxybutyryl-CoA dehydrogenase